VLALYSALVMGGTLIGAPIVGRVGDVLGPRYSLLVGSVATGLTVAGVLIHQATREGLRFDPHEAPGPPEEVEHPE
jgi:MFS family permease